MTNQSIPERPTAAYILSLIGGVLGLIIGLITLVFGIGIWILIASIIVIVSALELNAHPFEHTKWGIIIIVFSIIGLGSLLALIGGILALVYNPRTVAQQTLAGNIMRICPQCGRVLTEEMKNAKYCPYCGKDLESTATPAT